jgi:cation diffusion facilitator CzcD-associated flavoprotein CzcO
MASVSTSTNVPAEAHGEPDEVAECRVLVVGAGFSGIAASSRLTQEGIDDHIVLEREQGVGGTWRVNTYPGCACDIPTYLYSLSFAPNPNWSRMYATQPEIKRYAELHGGALGVLPKIRFGVDVTGAAWDDARQRWLVDTTVGRFVAQAVIAATGPLQQPNMPDVAGLAKFQGHAFHSAQWDHDYDLTGKKVAVIGTGASAIQFVPKIQGQVAHLTLFQRTAPWVLPKLDRPITRFERFLFRRVPGLQRGLREFIYGITETIQLLQRRPFTMKLMQQGGVQNLKKQVKDPELRAQLTPNHSLGCKRMLFSNTWYPAIQAPNATIVNSGVTEIRERSVVAADGTEHEVDTIIFGTGFHVTDPLIAKIVKGRDGRNLLETSGGHAEAYMGTTVSNFPNAFLMIGPNVGNGHGSALIIVEAQLNYVMDALKAMEASNLGSIEPLPAVQKVWNEKVQAALQGTVWNSGGCRSYYLDATGRNAAIYPWTTIDLRRRMRDFQLTDFRTVPARQTVSAGAN